MQLLKGDCLEKMKEIANESVDIVICDLPYGQTSCKWDNKIDIMKLWDELKRIGKPNTPYFFFTTTKFGVELITANPKWFRYDLVWEKTTNCGFLNARKMPMRNHEMIYVFYNKQPLYDIEKYHTISKPKDNIKAKIQNQSVYSKFELIFDNGSRYIPPLPKSIMRFGYEVNKKYKHKTQKPIALLEWILRYYSKPNDVVLDPTMGSGTTGVASYNLNRNFIGIELDETIYNNAVDRLLELTNKQETNEETPKNNSFFLS